MKQLLYILSFIICTIGVNAQSIINGDFENHTAATDQINMQNSNFTATMNNSEAFGTWGGGGAGGGNMDIITSNTYCGFSQSGSWHVAFTAGGSDAISLDLSAPLVMGNSYTISFWDRGCNPYNSCPVMIGVSNSSNTIGTNVYTAPYPTLNVGWTQRTFTFVAPSAATYITITCGDVFSGSLWTQVDNIEFVGGCTMPVVDLGNDTTLCTGSSLTVDATNTASTYLWQDNSTNPTYTITSAGTYFVDVTNACGTTTDTINVSYTNAPTVNLGNDTLLCQAGNLTLDATYSGATYLWQDNSTNPTLTVNQTGLYSVDVTNNCGTVSDDITVTYATTGVVDLGNDTTLCPGETLVLDATSPNSTYLWQDNSTNATFTISQAGSYYVDVTTICGTGTDTINVTYDVAPSVNLGNDTLLCQAGNLVLDATFPNATYLWQNGNTNPTFTLAQSGNYSVDVTNACGTATDDINVMYGTTPTVDLGNDTAMCTGGSFLLDASFANASYVWQDNSTNATFNVTQQGTYWVDVTTLCGTATDTVIVNLSTSFNVDLGPDGTICEGNSVYLDPQIPNSTSVWQDNSTSPGFNATSAGTYYVTVTSGTCTDSDTIVIAVNSMPEIQLGSDLTVCEGEYVVIAPYQPEVGFYQWSNGSTEPTITTNIPDDYILSVTNSCGTVSDTMSIYNIECHCTLFFPNTFTPNGDEFNQRFRPVYECNFYKYELFIYNRWGEEIFYTFDPNDAWDGNYDGKAVQSGTYIWVVKYESDFGILQEEQGFVNLLR